MTPAQRYCFPYVVAAANAISAMARPLAADDVRYLLHTAEAPRLAERQVDAAALSGNVAATKRACRLWWAAWQTAIHEHTHAPRPAAGEVG